MLLLLLLPLPPFLTFFPRSQLIMELFPPGSHSRAATFLSAVCRLSAFFIAFPITAVALCLSLRLSFFPSLLAFVESAFSISSMCIISCSSSAFRLALALRCALRFFSRLLLSRSIFAISFSRFACPFSPSLAFGSITNRVMDPPRLSSFLAPESSQVAFWSFLGTSRWFWFWTSWLFWLSIPLPLGPVV